MSIASAPTSFAAGKGHPDFDLRPADLRKILAEAQSTITPDSSV